jgi:hypothetical protein
MKQEKKISDMVENRITEHQLTKIRSFEDSFAKGREMIGGLTLQYEFQKSSILAQFAELEKDYSKLKSDRRLLYEKVFHKCNRD